MSSVLTTGSPARLGKSALPQAEATTVFCDFDGPIMDVSDRYYHTYQLALEKTARRSGQPTHQLSKAQFWQMKRDRLPDVEIALRSGLQSEQIALFLQKVSQIVNQPHLLHQDQLQPRVRWALELLNRQQMRIVLVTLRCQTQAVDLLQSYGLLHFFSSVWGASADAAYTNSAQHKTQLLQAAIESCTWETQAAWMVGDTEADVLAGQHLGINTIALTCGIRSQAYLDRLSPTIIRADLLSAAHHLICR